MATLNTILGYEYQTRTVQKFRFPNFWFVNQVGDEPIEGTIAKWDIEKPLIDLDIDFVTPSGAAQPVQMGGYGTRTQSMPITFKFMTLDPSVLSQLREVGSQSTRARAGRSYITREQAAMQRRFGAYLEEYMLAKALTGTLPIKIQGNSINIDYSLPASHAPTASASWATASTDIIADLTDWKRLIRQDSGFEPRWAICNQGVMNYLMKNTHVKDLIGSTSYGVQVGQSGQITSFHGLQWVVIDSFYAQPGAVERFDTPFIANDKLLLLPDFSPEWIAMQRGTVIIPNQSMTDFIELTGPAMWSRVTDSPTGLTMFYKNARLPVLRNTNAYVYADVTP